MGKKIGSNAYRILTGSGKMVMISMLSIIGKANRIPTCQTMLVRHNALIFFDNLNFVAIDFEKSL